MRRYLAFPVFAAVLLSACAVNGSRADGSSGSLDSGRGDGGLAWDASNPRRDATTPAPCTPTTGVDGDGDGYLPAVDCNDCTPLINPGAFDLAGNGIDEDCDGADALPGAAACDTGLAIDSGDPDDGARAIGLCTFTTETSGRWGVLSTRYTNADGSGALADPMMRGLLPELGAAAPREGDRLLALASGVARAPGQPGYTEICDYFTSGLDGYPAGYPRATPACGELPGPTVFDPAAFEVRIRVPTNANSVSFDSAFYTYEYPHYICSEYNDFFLVLMDPRPPGLMDDNIVFDDDGNWVSVNNSYLRVCTPGTHGGRTYDCPGGRSLLTGTGYDGTGGCLMDGDIGASTGWLHTVAPVEPGSIITLRFTVWDSSDVNLDSLVVIDNLEWSVEVPENVDPTPILI